MEKLTAKEILDIVEANMSVYAFAQMDFYDAIPKDFQFSDEVEKADEAKNGALNVLINHPIHKGTWTERENNAEYQAIKKVYNDLPSSYDKKNEEWFASLGLGKMIEVEQYGGEDQGSTWYSVKYFVDHDVYIRTDGYYSSYDGTDFDDGYGYEAEPVERLVTFYEPKKTV